MFYSITGTMAESTSSEKEVVHLDIILPYTVLKSNIGSNYIIIIVYCVQ